MKRITVLGLAIVFTLIFQAQAFSAIPETVSAIMSQDELIDAGEKIYQTPGQQTCLKCHREEGQGEGWAGAADLRKPYTWNSFLALGGYDALEADREGFLKELETVLFYLIQNGGVRWNTQFKGKHPEVEMDWSLTDGKTQYDMMMWGTVQKEMKVKIAAVQEELVASGKVIDDALMKDLAVYAVFEYIKEFEEENEDDDTMPLVFSVEE